MAAGKGMVTGMGVIIGRGRAAGTAAAGRMGDM